MVTDQMVQDAVITVREALRELERPNGNEAQALRLSAQIAGATALANLATYELQQQIVLGQAKANAHMDQQNAIYRDNVDSVKEAEAREEARKIAEHDMCMKILDAQYKKVLARD